MTDNLSEFLVFVDESGDHGLETIDKDYPVFVLERVSYYLKSQGVGASVTHVLVERRGRKEDAELELEFRRVCDGGNYPGKRLSFAMSFVHKQANSPGLQLADLVARPVGVSVLRPAQSNRAFQILEEKFYRNAHGKRDGWGLKCFP